LLETDEAFYNGARREGKRCKNPSQWRQGARTYGTNGWNEGDKTPLIQRLRARGRGFWPKIRPETILPPASRSSIGRFSAYFQQHGGRFTMKVLWFRFMLTLLMTTVAFGQLQQRMAQAPAGAGGRYRLLRYI
jgi:hypothetical protein